MSNAGKISLLCPTITKGLMRYTLSADAPKVSFSLFALNGAVVFRIDRENQVCGVYSVDLGSRVIQSHIASGMYLLVCSLGHSTFSYRVMVLPSSAAGGFWAQPLSAASAAQPYEAKAQLAAAVIDTIIITRDGYYDKKVPMQSYVADVGTINLDKIGSGSSYLAGIIAAYPFPLSSIRLNSGTRLDSMMRLNSNYLLSIDNDRLLYYFRQTAGLSSPGTALGGWEGLDVKGHFMGHLLSACAKGWASSGDTLLLKKGTLLVTELKKC